MSRFDNLLGTVINKTAIRMRLELGKLLVANNIDITVDQYVVLNRLFENQGISQNELASLTYKDKSSITRIIDILEEKEFVERQSIKGDRRAYQVYAKQKALDLKDKMRALAIQNIQRGIEGISEEEINIIVNSLEKIHSNYMK